MYGWTGQRLKVYLTEGKIVKEEIPEWLLRDYLGGRGLNAKTLFDEVEPDTDPLSPANVFMVGAGPFVGTLAPGGARYTVTAKSPLTGIFGDGNGGGDFAAELKFAGLDQVIFYGKSPKPVYLWISDDRVELRDASHLWGKDTWETHELLIKELGERELSEITIGPAGENLVRFAAVVANMSRAAGRCGIGAVMGAKNLKAVAVRGTGSVKIAKPDEFFEAAKYAVDKIISNPFVQMYRQTGSMFLLKASNDKGVLGTRNFQEAWFEGADKISSEAFEEQYAVRHHGCFACPTQCDHVYEVKEGPYATFGEGCEFSATANLGSRVGNDNLAACLYAWTLSNRWGIDNISGPGVIAFAMEAWQKGLISADDTEGLDLSWGNIDSVIELMRKICYREGFGDLLAEGVVRVSERIKGSSDFALAIKGMEAIAYEPRAHKGNALAFATATRGADHLRGMAPYILGWGDSISDEWSHVFGDRLGREKAQNIPNNRQYEGWGGLTALAQDFYAVGNSLEICSRMLGPSYGLSMEDLAKLLTTLTGVDYDEKALWKVGERVYNVEKAFNIREGLRRKDDNLPQRFLFGAVPRGPSAGEQIDPDKFQDMLDEYYEFRGWDKEGIPTKKKLDELNLSDIDEQLRDCRGGGAYGSERNMRKGTHGRNES